MNLNDGSSASPTKSFLRSSPRSSVDSHPISTSPFLQNLHQRLRKGSNASSSNSEPSLPPEGPSTPHTAEAVRRFVLTVVRDDWEYPTTVNSHNNSLAVREPVAFRSRQIGESDLDSDHNASKRRQRNDPYKFETPDAVAAIITERKRKRRRLEEEEMEWNVGLSVWSQRRDIWTATSKQKPKPKEVRRPATKLSRVAQESNTSDSTDGSMNWPSSPQSPNLDLSSSMESVHSVDTIQGPWLPIFPPLLAEDSELSSRIKPSAYPMIYSKVVIQSLTPNVPIPLTHMTSALVEGWKSEGNWPPSAAVLPTQDLKTGKKSSTFLKWRKEQEATGGPKGKVRRSFGAVKKALTIGSMQDPLEGLGIEFRAQDEVEMEGNVTLNKGLLNGNG